MSAVGEPSSEWQALVSAALLGVERAGLPKAQGAPAALLDARAADDPAMEMLQTAAVLSVFRQAGWTPAPGAGPGSEPAPADDLPLCSHRAQRQLAEILQGEFRSLLPEWCRLAAAAGLRAPDELLPALLREMASFPGEEAMIEPILGRRGRWLAGRNPEWARSLAGDEDHEVRWRDGDIDQRAGALAGIRGRDPDHARQLLEECWEEEAPREREKLVAALATNLSDADEPFLEAALDDRTSGVRKAAAALLARIPESRYAGRMVERARDLVRLGEKKGLVRARRKLQVALPGDLDKAMRRDGLSVRQVEGLGKKASLLLGIVRATPLRAWDGAEPESWIAAAARSDWSTPLIRGWTEAAASQDDREWAQSLIEHFVGAIRSFEDFSALGAEFYRVMSLAEPGQREAVAEKRLGGDPALAAAFVAACGHPWSEDFSRAVLQWLKHRLLRRSDDYDWRLRDRAKDEYARRLAPELAGYITGDWAGNFEGALPGLEDMADVMARTVRFRAEMRKELSP